MGNKRREGLARKLRKKRITSLTAPSMSLRDIEEDQAEISQFISLSRFRRIIRDIKLSLYRRPHGVFKQANYDNVPRG